MKKKNWPKAIREMVVSTQHDALWIAEHMPAKATTTGQRKLQKRHGTPREFALALIRAIGEISILEAQTAAEKYKREWERAV